MIAKGTKVRITTTNGGEIVATLLQNFRPTYDATIEVGGRWAIIFFARIQTVEVA